MTIGRPLVHLATPWYNTWYGWVGMLATAGLLAAIASAVWCYRRGVQLAALVAERTAELERRMAEAELAEATSGKLLRTVSHDLRTPLNNVFGALEIAELQAHRPADVVRWLGVARAAGVRLRLMLDDLIAHARSESGEDEVTVAVHVSVGRALGAALAEVRGLAVAQDRSIELAVAPGTPDVAVDPECLRHAVVDLVVNALTHTGSGAVRVTAERDGERVRVGVHDAGLELGDAERAALATPFRPGDPPPPVGPDLALSVARRQLARLGAELDLHVDAGGCTAWFALPAWAG